MFGKIFGKSTKTDKADNTETTEAAKVDIVTSEVNATAASIDENVEAVSRPEPELKDTKPPEKKQPAPLTFKEMRSLKKARYEEVHNNPKFKKVYLLKNTKTGQMVEVRAASSYHACKIIGWKPNKVVVMSEIEKEVKPPEAAK